MRSQRQGAGSSLLRSADLRRDSGTRDGLAGKHDAMRPSRGRPNWQPSQFRARADFVAALAGRGLVERRQTNVGWGDASPIRSPARRAAGSDRDRFLGGLRARGRTPDPALNSHSGRTRAAGFQVQEGPIERRLEASVGVGRGRSRSRRNRVRLRSASSRPEAEAGAELKPGGAEEPADRGSSRPTASG